MKLLLVDDSVIGRVVVHRNCIAVGFQDDEIVQAENGQTALQRFERSGCDGVITDWSMPVMDGLAFVKELRKRDQQIPILMFTASCRREDVIAAIEAGANDYLVKPFAPGDLQKKLRKLMALMKQNEAQSAS